MADDFFAWDGSSSYSYDNTWDPSGYSGSDFDFGGLSALNDSSWYSPAFDTWAGDIGYSETGLEPTNYAGDSGELSPLNDSQWYSNGSWLDGLSGGLERGVGMLGSVWDKLNAGSGNDGKGPSLLSQKLSATTHCARLSLALVVILICSTSSRLESTRLMT